MAFADTLVQLNIALQGKESHTKIEAMPIQYFIAKQYKHQYMYVGGAGQENSTVISRAHALPVGRYQLLVELEMPDLGLVGKEIKFKVSMQSTETYFMLSSKYADALCIQDPRAQVLYQQIFKCIALQRDERQYFGMMGKIEGRDKAAKKSKG